MSEPAKATDAPLARGDIICGCFGLSRGDIEDYIAARPDVSFDRLLAETNAGGKCTACMLDLEYIYVAAPRAEAVTGPSVNRVADEGPVSLRRRLFGLLDRIPPAMAFNTANWMPILAAPGIDVWLWFTNHHLLYEDSDDVVPFRVRYRVRDSEGRVRHEGRQLVGCDDMFRVNLSQYLEPGGANGLPAVGSVEVDRVAMRPGVRGTTRPQMEIITAKAACSLHSQAPGRDLYKHFSFPYRPDEERLVFSVINCGTRPFAMNFAYPLSEDIEPVRDRVAPPPYGVRLYEVRLPEDAPARNGRLSLMRLKGEGFGRIHLFCATPGFERISIDHL